MARFGLIATLLLVAAAGLVGAQAPAPSTTCPSGATNGGITAQPGTQCVWEGRTLYSGELLLNASSNLQTSALACCDSCQAEAGCNTWAWCGTQGGCCTDPDGCPMGDPTALPFHGCQLMSQESLDYANESPAPSVIYNASMAAQWGPTQMPASSATTSGVYLTSIVEAEQLPGYMALQGQDYSSNNYRCSGSLYEGRIIGGCRLNGTLSELAAGCQADPKCSAFSYQPYGCCTSTMDSEISESGWRKKGTVSAECTTLLPQTTLYILTDRSSAASA